MTAHETAPRAGTRGRGGTHGGTPRPDGRGAHSVPRRTVRAPGPQMLRMFAWEVVA